MNPMQEQAQKLIKTPTKKQSLADLLEHGLSQTLHGMSLRKGPRTLTILFFVEEDLVSWMQAIAGYVIQGGIYDKFIFSKILGEGTFGKVFLASSCTRKQIRKEADTNPFVAIKVMHLAQISQKPEVLENLISEIRVHWVLEKCDGMLGL